MPSARVLLVALALVPAPVAAQWPPATFENLQVLPEEIDRRELIDLMASFTRALGVRCSYCHVGEEGRPLSTYDFPSDDKLAKRKAREMLRMVEAINARHLPALEERQDPSIEVRCETCHGGITAPRRLQEILLLAYEAGGVDSSLAAYRSLRERYYGRAAYDFGTVPLADVGAALGERGDLEDAVRLLTLNLELFPEVPFVQRQYVQSALLLAFVTEGPEGGTARYRDLAARYPGAFPEFVLNGVGYGLLERGRPAEAVAVFRLNVEAYPESWNAYDSLGEGYGAVGDVERAIESYERSLALNPDNGNAAERLAELRARGPGR